MAVLTRSASVRRALLAGCVVGVCQSMLLGGVTFTSGTAKWTFDADTNGGDQQKSINLTPPASGSMPAPPTFQLNQKYTSGTGSATAFGSIGYVVNPTTATFTLAPGTGVQQNDPNNLYTGDSLVRIDFDGFFSPTAPSFGPPAAGYVSVAVGGIVGTGGHSQFTGQVDFLNGSTNVALRPSVKFDKLFSTAGSFAQTFTSSSLLAPSSVPVGTKIRVKGFFTFRASNAITPSSILPLDVEFGGAPPTATWYSTDSTSWSSPANWAAPAGSVIDDPDQTIPTVPNGAGQRARIVSIGGTVPHISLDQNIVLGAIDINAAGTFTLSSSGSSTHSLNLRTGGGSEAPATFHARNINGDSNQSINVPVSFEDGLQILTEGTYQGPGSIKPAADVSFNNTIDGSGNAKLTKTGRGTARLNAANRYTGGTVVSGGRLEANVAGSLGSGDVLADAGLLAYNAVHAVEAGATILADNGGQIDLGVTPAVNERFNVGSYGIISGNNAELTALNVRDGGNLQLSAGATIAHETFDFGFNEGNPQGLAAAGAQYIFGIAGDFDSSVGGRRIINIGSESGTPWRGFGSDRLDRYFGTDPRGDHEQILVAGAAELRALDETLILNGQLISITGTTTLTKTGAGAVQINNIDNNFRAPINVHEGSLYVNGLIHGVTQLTVESDTRLGGNGSIQGAVAMKGNATLAPGDNSLAGHIGTLLVGDLHLGDQSNLEFELNEPGVVGDKINDLLIVSGDLTLGGILNIFDAGGFGIGTYELLQYRGDLTDNGLEFGYVPDDGLTYKLEIVPIAGIVETGGGSLMLTVVPEPTGIAATLGAIALGSLTRRRRRA